MPLGILGTVALIAAVETFVAWHDDDLTGLGTFAWRYSAEAARREAPHHQVLCLGSSLTKWGLLARVVGHGTGRPCFNLAVGNGRVSSSYYLLKHALEAGARPAAVLVDCLDGPVDPNGRDDGPLEALESNWRSWPELVTLREAAELAATARNADFLTSVVLSQALPSYRGRFEIRAALRALARGEGERTSSRLWLRIARRNWDFNRGTLVKGHDEPPAPAEPEPEPADAAAGPALGPLVSNRLGEAYTGRLLELAQAHGIAVFWILPPMPPRTQAARAGNGHDAYFASVARAAMARFPNVVVVDGRRSGYPACRFADHAHLGRLGSYAYSADLAAIVARHLAAPATSPRWCALPRYRDRPVELPVEDMNASTTAVLLADRERHDRRRAAPAWAERERRGIRSPAELRR